MPCLGQIIMLLKSTLILMFAGVSILAMGDNAAFRTDTAEQAMCWELMGYAYGSAEGPHGLRTGWTRDHHMDCQPW